MELRNVQHFLTKDKNEITTVLSGASTRLIKQEK